MSLKDQMVKYLSKHWDEMFFLVLEHIYLVLISVGIAFLIAVAFTLICRRFRKFGNLIIGFFNMTYSLPSMALLALLLPYFGLGKPTAIACIVIYEQFLLLKNMLVGFDSVNPSVIESATGMGMNRSQVFFRVMLPLALPTIINGMKLAFLSAIGIAVIGAFISAGGIGSLIYDGLRRQYTAKIVIGTVLTTILSVTVNEIFQKLEQMALIHARGGFIRKGKGKKHD